ncbi:Oxygen-independent coproporphyrinogen III oxidase [Sulfitobacter noctilucicola]|nr:oxygen-independent coproporphyrinogen III oxidase [Sulfitobacter noctilucicola]KIN64198.1 Oxygen-independent coproporphyrinogen III oxidase [Sulfitobacter noctilucicola]
MEKIDQLRAHGLFDAKVPRYTSYPPANHFEDCVGQRMQSDWLQTVADGSDISVYIHIPFCKRLCWFCACRTQGTKTMRPVEAYVEVLRREIASVRALLPANVRMARLHLGGGTPTILEPHTMRALLGDVFDAFELGTDFEFSVEIDPTEASPELLQTLIDFGLNRASLGVQDFAPEVQKAIGRPQSLEQTRSVIAYLRKGGVKALNLDLLYGLPHQTMQSFRETLDHVISMEPDRLAIYGYAHVPWMSKRQVMIKDADLPDSDTRFALAGAAKEVLNAKGFKSIGIDHFAKSTDKLAIAQREGRVRRNFQGYTDDQCETLIGLGASSISRFKQGYLQNAVATSAYQDRIDHTQIAGHKGYAMTEQDVLTARIVEDLLCRFAFEMADLYEAFPTQKDTIRAISVMLMRSFPDAFFLRDQGLGMMEWAKPLVRIVASRVDQFSSKETGHSAAI